MLHWKYSLTIMKAKLSFAFYLLWVLTALRCSEGSYYPPDLRQHFCYGISYKTEYVAIPCPPNAYSCRGYPYYQTRQVSYIDRRCCEGWIGEYCDRKLICDTLYIPDIAIRDIQRVDIDEPSPSSFNLNVDPPDASPVFPIAITVDSDNALVYFSDVFTRRIYSAELDGSNAQEFYNTGPDSSVWGMTIDMVNEFLLYTDTGSSNAVGGKIVILPYSGGVPGTPVEIDFANEFLMMDEPRGIAVIPEERQMYWTDWGIFPYIARAGYNGLSPEILISSDLTWPNDLTLDVKDGKFYWVDGFLDKVERANLDGTGREVIYQTSNAQFFGIQFNDDYLYITNWRASNLQRLYKDGGPLYDLTETTFRRAMAIAEYCEEVYVESQYCCCEGFYGPDCTIQCNGDLEYNPNGSPCDRTCDEPDPVCPTQDTIPKCECPRGLLLQKIAGTYRCIERRNCPPMRAAIGPVGPFDCASNNPCASVNDGVYEHADSDKYVLCQNRRCSVESCSEGVKIANIQNADKACVGNEGLPQI